MQRIHCHSLNLHHIVCRKNTFYTIFDTNAPKFCLILIMQKQRIFGVCKEDSFFYTCIQQKRKWHTVDGQGYQHDIVYQFKFERNGFVATALEYSLCSCSTANTYKRYTETPFHCSFLLFIRTLVSH